MEKNMKSSLNFFYFAGIRSLPRQKTAQYFLTRAIQIQNPILTPQTDFGLTKPKERAILWLMAYVRIQERQVVKVARPRKCRRVCTMPAHDRFGPLAESSSKPPVVLSVDEYETIRLVDLEGYTQQQCAGQMGIARTTVQGIYDLARKKIARAIVEGRQLLIQGGDYRLCQGRQSFPCCCHCSRHARLDPTEPNSDEKETQQHE